MNNYSLLSFTKNKLQDLSKTGVYAVINHKTNLFYIGSTSVAKEVLSASGFYYRWWHHLNSLKKNQHRCKHLQHSWNKYGSENFEFRILEVVEPEFCVETEQEYLDACDKSLLYNTYLIAGSPKGYKCSSQEIERRKEINSKTFFFLNLNNQVVSIKNLTQYAKDKNLSFSSLWQLANGIKEEYAGLQCLPDIYNQKQKELNFLLEKRRNTEYIPKNVSLVKHLGKVKYRVSFQYKKEKIFDKMTKRKEEALEIALLISQIYSI